MQTSADKYYQDLPSQSTKENYGQKTYKPSKNQGSPSYVRKVIKKAYKKDQLLAVYKICKTRDFRVAQSLFTEWEQLKDILNEKPIEPEYYASEPVDLRYCQAAEKRNYHQRGGSYQQPLTSSSQRKQSPYKNNKGGYGVQGSQQKYQQDDKDNNYRKNDSYQRRQDDEGYGNSRSYKQKDLKRPGGEDGMWDEDFTKKKFELGRVIERSVGSEEHRRELDEMKATEKKNKENMDRGRVIRTTSIDFFLNSDNMTKEQIQEQQNEEEEDPLWNDVDVEKLKQESKTTGISNAAFTSTNNENKTIKTNIQQDSNNTDQNNSKNSNSQDQWMSHQLQQLNLVSQDDAIITMTPGVDPALHQQQIQKQISDHVATLEQQQQLLTEIYAKMIPSELGGMQQSSTLPSAIMTQQYPENQQMLYQQHPMYQMNLTPVNHSQYVQHSPYQMNDFQTAINPQAMPQMDQHLLYQQQLLESPTTLQLSPDALSASPNPFALSNSVLVSKSGQEQMWYYKDPSGQVRGPFTQAQMSAWYELGYFQDDLEIAYGENSMFLPLKNYKDMSLSQHMSGNSTPIQNFPGANQYGTQFQGIHLQHMGQSPQLGAHQVQDFSQLGMLQAQAMYDPSMMYNQMAQAHYYPQSPINNMGMYLPQSQMQQMNPNQQQY